MSASIRHSWSSGRWTHPPVLVVEDGNDLLITAAAKSDAWRHTAYGFVHDTEHALVAPLVDGTAMEVTFTLDYGAQFDQAGIFVSVSVEEWMKAGVEVSDGRPQLGAVITHGTSDWSLSPISEWLGTRVTIRASRAGDAITFRARSGDGEWRMFRLAQLAPEALAYAGPFLCAPTNESLTVRFHSWIETAADTSLH